MARVMQRRGRRAGLVLGYAIAALGGGLAAAGAGTGAAAGLAGGMLLLGAGNAGAQLSRYAAADLAPPHRRGAAMGTLLWAVTAGAAGGPLLLAPAGQAAAAAGAAAIAGPLLLAALAAGAGLAAASLPPLRAAAGGGVVRLRALLRAGPARPALTVMATAQVVMVAVMTATPVAMHMGGQGLAAVGLVLSAHTFGMFALSPLTGWLADRLGSRAVMSAGLAVLAAATAAAGLAPARTAALFLLGYGWNLCFIGGSAHLAGGLPPLERARVEGAVDAGVWAAAAIAGLAGTALLGAVGYPLLTTAAGLLVTVPALMLTRRWHRPRQLMKGDAADGGMGGDREGRPGVRYPGAREV